MGAVVSFIALLATLLGAGYWLYSTGYENGQIASTVDAQKQVISTLQGVIAEKDAELAADAQEDRQATVDMVALQKSLEVIERRSGSFGAQFNAALEKSGLSGCLYPDDVRRLRHEQSVQTRESIERTNAAIDRLQNKG